MSSQQTASKAAEMLEERHDAKYSVPTAKQRRELLVAYAKAGMVLYGKAFDIVMIPNNVSVDLDDQVSIGKHIDDIIICEIKSTNRREIGEDFEKYFFAITAAEMLVAQSLDERYRFVFVNVTNRTVSDPFSLQEVLGKAKKIYPTWSVQF